MRKIFKTRFWKKFLRLRRPANVTCGGVDCMARRNLSRKKITTSDY